MYIYTYLPWLAPAHPASFVPVSFSFWSKIHRISQKIANYYHKIASKLAEIRHFLGYGLTVNISVTDCLLLVAVMDSQNTKQTRRRCVKLGQYIPQIKRLFILPINPMNQTSETVSWLQPIAPPIQPKVIAINAILNRKTNFFYMLIF